MALQTALSRGSEGGRERGRKGGREGERESECAQACTYTVCASSCTYECVHHVHIEMSAVHVMRDAQDGEHQAMKARMEAALQECEQAREVCLTWVIMLSLTFPSILSPHTSCAAD